MTNPLDVHLIFLLRLKISFEFSPFICYFTHCEICGSFISEFSWFIKFTSCKPCTEIPWFFFFLTILKGHCIEIPYHQPQFCIVLLSKLHQVISLQRSVVISKWGLNFGPTNSLLNSLFFQFCWEISLCSCELF